MQDHESKIDAWPAARAGMSTEPLWTVRELAEYLRYKPKTIANLLTGDPGRLPPRISGLGHPRWEPGTVRAWAVDQSRPAVKRGRPRLRS